MPLVGSVEDAPQIGSLSPAVTELFKGVIAKYFAEEDPLCPIGHLPHNGENHPESSLTTNNPEALPPHYGGGLGRWLWHRHSRNRDCEESSV